MPRQLAPAVLASLALAAAGCGGDSAEERAQSQVCDARASIQESIDSLEGLTLSTATRDEIRGQLEGIRKDLGTIRDARGDLKADQRDQLEEANAQFVDTLRTVAQTVLRSTSAEEASTELKSAAGQLQTTYESALSPIDCS